jgi:hypothetical protein
LYFVFTDIDTDTVDADFDKQHGRRSTGNIGSYGHDTDNKETVATLLKMAKKDTKDTTLIYESKSHIYTILCDCAKSRKLFNDYCKRC